METLDKITPQSAAAELQAGVAFKQGIELYDCVETNENFFIGKQWEGVEAGGLPTPVFNFLKRVVLFAVANVSTDNWTLHAQPLSAESEHGPGLELLTEALNQQFAALFEANRLGTLLRQFTRNAAVDGDGCTYTYWDGTAPGGGTIRTELLRNTQVHFGNPNSREVEEQPYLLIERRELLERVRQRAEACGADSGAVVPDEKSGGGDLDALGGDKVTVLLEDENEVETYQIVTTMRQDALHGLISRESPVGKALLGHKVGDRVHIQVDERFGYDMLIQKLEKGRDDGSIPLNSY